MKFVYIINEICYSKRENSGGMGMKVEKKILIVVDGSIHSKKAIEYATLIDDLIVDCNYILFNVQPTISEYLLIESHLDKNVRLRLNRIKEKNKKEAEKILKEAKDFMISKGIKEERISTVTVPKTMDVARDILNFAKQNSCDAILIGRRGVTKLEEMFTYSVSSALLEHVQTIPLWAVSGDVRSKNIAVAIDGSESSLRAVEYVGFMFENNQDIKITLLHVIPKLRDYCPIDFEEDKSELEDIVIKGDRKCVESFFVHAKRLLEKSGIKSHQLEIREIPSLVSIAKTIVNEVKENNYGTLVLGRSGIGESFFLGSVSRYCFYNVNDCAVWIVP